MGKCILVVEDDLISFMVAKELFKRHGMSVENAKSGEEAVRLYTQHITENKPYYALYMDLGLPNMNGIETCIAIRNYEATAALSPISIIAVTGNKSPATDKACLSAGMMDVLAKPLNTEKVSYFLSKCS